MELRGGRGGFWHVKCLRDEVRGKVSGERGRFGTLKAESTLVVQVLLFSSLLQIPGLSSKIVR